MNQPKGKVIPSPVQLDDDRLPVDLDMRPAYTEPEDTEPENTEPENTEPDTADNPPHENAAGASGDAGTAPTAPESPEGNTAPENAAPAKSIQLPPD